ncbi:MAG: hypothetical protein AAF483_02075 [Planctomycetota bacterium]
MTDKAAWPIASPKEGGAEVCERHGPHFLHFPCRRRIDFDPLSSGIDRDEESSVHKKTAAFPGKRRFIELFP